MHFSSLILEWQPFYGAVTMANATLAGLLFFSLTYNGAVLERPENDHLHRLAEQAASNFIILILIGLLFLIPHPTGLTLGVPLIIIGLCSAYLSGQRLWKQYRHVDNTPYLYWRFIISLACSLVLAAFGEDLLRQEPVTFFWLTIVIFALVISSCSDAWFLLMRIPRDALLSGSTSSESTVLAPRTKKQR